MQTNLGGYDIRKHLTKIRNFQEVNFKIAKSITKLDAARALILNATEEGKVTCPPKSYQNPNKQLF